MKKAKLIALNIDCDVISHYNHELFPIFRILYTWKGKQKDVVIFCNNRAGINEGLKSPKWNFECDGKIHWVAFSCDYSMIEGL